MKLGIATPVVTNVAGAPLTWEKDATIEDIGRVAETADRLGYHHMTCSEHIGLPSTETGRRGARYWDPLATFGYVSARTTQIRFATMTLVLGYHHPLAIVKRYGTLDHVSNGRVILGRRRRLARRRSSTFSAHRSMIAVLAATMRCGRCGQRCRAMSRPMTVSSTRSVGSPSIRVRCSRICRSGSAAAPNARCGARSRSPMAGARSTSRSTPRREWLQACELPPDFEVVLPADQPLDPVGEPEATAETLDDHGRGRHHDACLPVFVHHSLEHYLEQIHALAELNDKTAG